LGKKWWPFNGWLHSASFGGFQDRNTTKLKKDKIEKRN
jgi:hypothetical protein